MNNNGSSGCLTICLKIYIYLFVGGLLFVFGLALLFKNPLIGLIYFGGIYFYIKTRQKNKKEAKIRGVKRRIEEFGQEIFKRKELLIKLKRRLELDKNPDSIEEYKEVQMNIYNLDSNNVAIDILDWNEEPTESYDTFHSKTQDLYGEIMSDKILILSGEDLTGLLNEKLKELEKFNLNNFYFDLAEAKKSIDLIGPFLPDKEESLARKEAELRRKENVHMLANSYKQRKSMSTFKQNLLSINNLLSLTPIEFEKWVKKNVFEKEGWVVSETKITGDGGIDLVLHREDEHSIAQCKRYKQTVGEPMIRDFYGAMINEGVSRGYIVTTGLFSLSALKFAENKPIELIDRRILAQKYL